MKVTFKQVSPDGLVVTSVMEVKPQSRPYFSISTHERMPLPEGFERLHCNDFNTGLPLHFLANTEYFVREGKFDIVARNLGFDPGDALYKVKVKVLLDEKHRIERLLVGLGKAQKDAANALAEKHKAAIHYYVDKRLFAKEKDALIVQQTKESEPLRAELTDILAQLRACWEPLITRATLEWGALASKARDYLKKYDGHAIWLTGEPVAEDYIVIDNERVPCKVTRPRGQERSLEISTGDAEYILFKDEHEAGEAARDYWADMAKNGKEELVEMVGSGVLLSRALGKPAGPGRIKVPSLSAWMDLWLDTPKEHFASSFGESIDVELSPHLIEEYGSFHIGYRTN